MWKQKEINAEKQQMLVDASEHRLMARLMSQRDVNLDSDYKNMSDPFSLHGVKEAVEIFIDAVKGNKVIKIFSDYDADGVFSAVMIHELCMSMGIKCHCMFSNRLEHGYGLNEKSVAEIKLQESKEEADLLFVLDSGTNSFNEIEELKKTMKAKIIIIDHHLAEGKIATNSDVLISWHLGGNCEMCTCGEIYQFIRGVRWFTKSIDPIEFLSYAAIGTIADVSPVMGDNRIIVKNGLTDYALNKVNAAGLNALLQQTKIHPTALTQEDVSFKIAPQINAVGRMYHPDIAFGLLTERDVKSAEKLAAYITTYNDERKLVQKKIEKEALAMSKLAQSSHGVLTYGKDWHIGVVGIVASRLVEIYDKPSIVIGYHNGVWKGSGRSIHGINLKEILDGCSEMFESYGGHASAVGVTVKDEYIDKAPALFNEACKKYLEKHKIADDNDKFFDAKLKVKAITPDICKILIDRLYPYCKAHNPEPVFKISGVNIVEADLIERDTWKLLKIHVEKDGFRVPYSFKTFSPSCGGDIEGRKADIIFRFPQKTQDPSNRYFSFELSAIDIALL